MMWTPVLVLLASALLTCLVTLYISRLTAAKDYERLQNATQAIRDDIHARIETYLALLRGAGALVSDNPTLRPESFHSYVRQLGVDQNYSGIQGIGFSRRIRPDELQEVTQAIGKFLPDFRVWPETPRDEYHSIVFLEPLTDRNLAAMGFDMFTEEVRRAAMERAWETGRFAATARVTLVQEIHGEVQPGFIIYLPVYQGGGVPPEHERREKLIGFVYAPFRVGDLLKGIFGTQTRPRSEFEIYDGEIAPEHLLHRSDRFEEARAAHPGEEIQEALEVAGRLWLFRSVPNEEFDYASGREFASFVFLGGIVISLGFASISWLQARARRSAEVLATQLARSREALRLSEARARQIIESSVVGIIVADFHGRVYDANDAFLGTFGYSREEVSQGRLNWREITPPEFRAADDSAMADMLASGRHAPYQKEYFSRDGRRIPVLVATAYLGNRLGATIVLDLSDVRRREEIERRYTQQMMLRAKVSVGLTKSAGDLTQLLQPCVEAIVEHLDAALARIWVLNPETDVLELKASAGIHTHLDGAHGRITVGDLKIGAIAERREPYLSNTLQDDPNISDPEWVKEQGLVAFAGCPLVVDGRLIGVLALFSRHVLAQDTTEVLGGVADILAQGVERRRAEAALARYREHLETLVRERTQQLELSQERLRRSERLASLGTLATGIAHEINNPVNAILLSSEYALMVRGEPEWEAVIDGTLRDIVEQAKRCGKIVRNVLRFARKEAEAQRGPQDVNEIVRRAADLTRSYVGEARLALELDLDPSLPPAMLDATQIEQVVVNLIQNAAQVTSGSVRVQLSTQRQNGDVVIRVKDDGPGIPHEHLRHIFDPFFSTRREKGGTGLGLSMVHGIITEHNGWIDVESQAGQGATFTIHLPASCPAGAGAGDGQDPDRRGRADPSDDPQQDPHPGRT